MALRPALRTASAAGSAPRSAHLRPFTSIPRSYPISSSTSAPRPRSRLSRLPARIRTSLFPKVDRGFASAPPSEESSSTSLTEDEYNEVADRDMDLLHESVEILCEEYGPPEWEVEYSSGVMTIRLPPHGTYVINKQPPNQQIWISSPLSGPSRFGWDPNGEAWTHHRKPSITLGKLLEEEMRQLSNKSGIDVEGWEGTGLH